IISGEQEALWVFQGVTSDPELAGQPLLIVDAGGGSTEFILGIGLEQRFRQSFALGTVRLLESVHVCDPPSASDWRGCRPQLNSFLETGMAPALRPRLREVGAAPIQLIGTSGTASVLASMELGLARFNRERIEGSTISLARLQKRRHELWNLTLAERKKIVGL